MPPAKSEASTTKRTSRDFILSAWLYKAHRRNADGESRRSPPHCLRRGPRLLVELSERCAFGGPCTLASVYYNRSTMEHTATHSG